MIHPLLWALPDGTDSEEFVKNLGFEVQYETHFLGNGDLPEGHELKDWKPDTPEAFYSAGKWVADDGYDGCYVACFLKPTTPLATALWLIGLGEAAQDNPPKPHYSYRAAEDQQYTGKYPTVQDAVTAANQELPPGTEAEAALFRTPLASEFIDAEDISGVLFCAAEEYFPDDSHIWPDTPDNCSVLSPAVKLLIDGWAKHTGNEPTFGIPD